MQAHCDTHNKLVGYLCETCGKRFQKQTILKEHQRSHNGAKPFGCDICGKSFSHSGNLHSHVRTVHCPKQRQFILKQKPKTATEDVLKVTAEELIQASMAGLPKGEQTFVCTICGYRFDNGATLLAHYRIHLGEKPYQCDVCGRGYMMVTHLEYHPCLNGGPFKCGKCGKAFKSSSELNKHLRTDNDPYIHKCEYCPNRFNTVCSLHFHLGKHDLKQCASCDKQFLRQESLEEHVSANHPDNELKFKDS